LGLEKRKLTEGGAKMKTITIKTVKLKLGDRVRTDDGLGTVIRRGHMVPKSYTAVQLDKATLHCGSMEIKIAYLTRNVKQILRITDHAGAYPRK
jgi:hypothetical protein